MTQTLEHASAHKSGPAGHRASHERSGRILVVMALIISLIGCGFTRAWASRWKDHRPGAPAAVNERGLAGMNSYALALMLGGLRGPLVMVLWSKVESQKIDRDLEDVDTMIEWIRLLQPEFDTVHIFQIWNKAYNISVMMASTASKYVTILDAIDYARRVDRDRPGNINIMDSLAQVFAEKLGGKNTQERNFYRQQFREDSMTDENVRHAFPQEHYHRLGLRFVGPGLGPILDDQNNFLPSLTAARFAKPADLPANSEWNDGAELQYLRKYQPFAFGVSPSAMGYNYAKRAQVAMTVLGQKPLQLSDIVIDSRPGLLLKQWAEEEADRGVRYESKAFGVFIEADPEILEGRTTPLGPDHKIEDPHDLQIAIYSYQTAARAGEDSLVEYERHLRNTQYLNEFTLYESHQDELRAMRALSIADKTYLQALLPGADRQELLADAAQAYAKATIQYERILLKYYVEDPIVAKITPLGTNRTVYFRQVPDDQIDAAYQKMEAELASLPENERIYNEQRRDYGLYLDRCNTRIHLTGFGQKSVLQKD